MAVYSCIYYKHGYSFTLLIEIRAVCLDRIWQLGLGRNGMPKFWSHKTNGTGTASLP